MLKTRALPMPRQPRYFLPNIPQHIIMRGVDRQATFFGPDDYLLYKEALRSDATASGCAIHAYVLMTNHVHLLVTPASQQSIPEMIQGLGRNYVQRINRCYGRTGTLWQGRYKACIVQDDKYLLRCQQYIELNPVRAAMVSDPANYAHSSYRSNALGTIDPIITPHEVYASLGDSSKHRRHAYRRMCESTLDRELIDRIRETTNACRVLGNETFTNQIESLLGRRVRPARQGRPPKKPAT